MNPFYKGFSFLSIISLPTLGIYFYNSSGKALSIGDLGGFTTRVNLFLEDFPKSELTQTAALIGDNREVQAREIIKVSSETSKKEETKIPVLRAEFNLKYLDRKDYWKYCLPTSGTNLFKKQEKVTQSSSEISQNSECNNWKNLNQSTKSEEDVELITELLQLLNWFLRVEHVYNMLMLYGKNTKIEEIYQGKNTQTLQTTTQVTNNQNRKNENWLKEIKEGCNLSGDEDKKSLNYLFLSTDLRKKSCIPAPSIMNVNLKLNNGSGSSLVSNHETNNQNTLNKDKISKGEFSGNLGYSFFDYWAKKKVGKEENSSLPTILFKTQNKYSLSEIDSSTNSQTKTPYNLKKYFGLVESKELKLSNFNEKIVVFEVEKNSNNSKLIY